MRYFLVTYVKKPNGQIDEQVALSRNVKPKDIQTCNVIMDYKNRKIDKCVIDGMVQNREFDKLHEYYKAYYPNVIGQLEDENQQEGQ